MPTLAMSMDMEEETLHVAIERECYRVKWKRGQDVWCQGRRDHAETLERGGWMHADQDPHQPPSGRVYSEVCNWLSSMKTNTRRTR